MIKLSHRVRRNTEARHLQAQRLKRYRAIVRAIPRDTSPRLFLARKAYAGFVVSRLGRRKLARVVWPWQKKALAAKSAARVFRGRLSNPTALR